MQCHVFANKPRISEDKQENVSTLYVRDSLVEKLNKFKELG
jgi:hypothetical protein